MNVLETMKQALEALLMARPAYVKERLDLHDEAITNLRAAIAEMEAEVCSSCSSELNKCRITGTKQEPVAWIDEFGNAYPLGAWKPSKATYHDSYKAKWKPLYTALAVPEGEK